MVTAGIKTVLIHYCAISPPYFLSFYLCFRDKILSREQLSCLSAGAGGVWRQQGQPMASQGCDITPPPIGWGQRVWSCSRAYSTTPQGPTSPPLPSRGPRPPPSLAPPPGAGAGAPWLAGGEPAGGLTSHQRSSRSRAVAATARHSAIFSKFYSR